MEHFSIKLDLTIPYIRTGLQSGTNERRETVIHYANCPPPPPSRYLSPYCPTNRSRIRIRRTFSHVVNIVPPECYITIPSRTTQTFRCLFPSSPPFFPSLRDARPGTYYKTNDVDSKMLRALCPRCWDAFRGKEDPPPSLSLALFLFISQLHLGEFS